MSVKGVPQKLVDDLRSAFLNELEAKGTDTIHAKDYEKIKTNDHLLRRFLAHQKQSVPNACKMMWTSLLWRKELNVNEISEKNIKMDLIIKGCFFPYGKDVMGSKLFVFRGKLHNKATNQEELRRCIIYWFERIERSTEGEPISLFFDMDGCGLTNMDMDLIKYLIGLFKEYYPYFLNLIIIFEMAWVLSAAFKVIKSWLPEEAIEKIKFVTKKDLSTVVPPEEILKYWGGNNPYVFTFIPEEIEKPVVESNNTTIKKVHFSDGSPMSDHLPSETQEDGPLKVHPTGIITFVREKTELVSTLELYNTDATQQVVFKLKTTSPEKFKVKPSTGRLQPGSEETVTVTLLQGFQLGGLSKDKFLVMSCVVEDKDALNLDLSEFWKNPGGRKVYQNRLRCVQSGEMTRNGNIVEHASSPSDKDTHLSKLTSSLVEIHKTQKELIKSINRNQKFQLFGLIVTIVIAAVMFIILNKSIQEISNKEPYCPYVSRP